MHTIDGWSLARHLRLTHVLLACVVACAGAAVFWFLLGVPVLWPGLVLLSLGGSALLVALAVGPAQTRASIAERANGYTTSRRGFVEVAEVDPRSGRVIRLAGEPLLEDDERARRLAVIASMRAG
ncbi:hypothetical protein ACFVTX_03255 [Agromyces sp. NPDC058136]|uniref:hypothetical protein n=1 Tax=Agromyces sp. NPDC058136 TaxID=3346354 RepID=UPI0036D7BBB1